MDYHEWAAEYLRDAGRIMKVIEKKKLLLKDKNLSADESRNINDSITAYRRIYRELVRTAGHLQARVGQAHEA